MPYHLPGDFEAGLSSLASAYPSTCTLIPLVYPTVEGRTLYGVRIGLGGDVPGICFLGGLHAREWMPPEICLSLAADLLEAYDSGTGLSYGPVSYSAAEIRQIIESFHVYVIPTGNPDGYNYSRMHDSIGTSGGWRRNRNPAESGGNSSCVGVDLNRNYDILFNFLTQLSPAADLSHISTDPCHFQQIYHGPSPNSEEETKSIVRFLDDHPDIRWFFDIHSYSQLIMWPWGHDEDQTSDPSQNFLNPVHDGARGVAGDGYAEYVDPGDLAAYQALAEEIRLGIVNVRGRDYTKTGAFGLYPTTGASTDYAYSRHTVDPSKPKIMTFALETGNSTNGFRPAWTEAEEVIREVSSGLIRFMLQAPCITWPLTVAPPTPAEIEFDGVPEGLTTYRAIVFEVTGCAAADVRIVSGPTVTSGPTGTSFGTPAGLTSDLADPRPNPETPAYARVWISYTGTSDGDSATGTVRVRCDATGEEWDITIRASTRARPSVAVMLSLDQSGSMDDPAGDLGATRIEVLREAAARFVELVPAGNAVGLVRFDHDAYAVGDATYPGLAMTHIAADDMADLGRVAARTAVMAHATNPAGWTSIGDGVVMARSVLTPVSGYDEKAIVVFTDGRENRPESIESVLGSIDARTFAIGLGTETQVSTDGLMALAGVRDGYLLLTGHLTAGTDDYFRLTKYFHQILAGVTRTDIVRDPTGTIGVGAKHRIPFSLTEADVEATVILLSDLPVLRFWVETPAGDKLDPGIAAASGATFSVGTGMAFYRFGLPLPVGTHGAQAGQWHAVLEIDEERWERYSKKFANDKKDHSTVRYSLSVHAYSNVRMRARIDQNSLEPGATLALRSVLTEYDVPLAGRATVAATIERPDGTTFVLNLAETEPGIFEAETKALMAGLYRVLVRAKGKSRRGLEFSREQLLTAAAFRGGDKPSPPDGGPSRDGREDWCDLLRCLLGQNSIRDLLERQKIDPEAVLKCLDAFCRKGQVTTGEGAEKPLFSGALISELTQKLQRAKSGEEGLAVLKKFLVKDDR